MQIQKDTFYDYPSAGRAVRMPEACTIEGHARPVYPRTLMRVPGPRGSVQKVCPKHYQELLHGSVLVEVGA